jgi:fatty acid CoA ligase FadD9
MKEFHQFAVILLQFCCHTAVILLHMVELSTAQWRIDRSVPIQELSIGGLLRSTVARAPDAVALVDGRPDAAARRQWTYAELLDQSERAARALLGRFSPDDRVAVLANNSTDWVILELAAGLAGVTLVTVNPALRAEEMTYILRQSRSNGIFFGSEYQGPAMAEMLNAIGGELPDLRDKISFTDWEAFCGSGLPSKDLPDVDPGAAAQILYTSGTTGRPKGAVLHHRGLVNSARLYVTHLGAKPGMVQVSAMPLFHIVGCGLTVLGSIASAGTLVLPPYFDPALMLELIESERVAWFFGVPTMLIACLDHPRLVDTDLSSVRFIVAAGAPVLPALVRRTEEAFDARLCIGFGQTETAGCITLVSSEDEPAARYNTIGRPVAQTEVKIVDTATGELLAPDGEGELCTRGYFVMSGYFDNPEATNAAIDDEGWLHTGDLASMDAHGYCRITGRLKDMIIRGGENIYPREIEQVLFEHEDVADVAVVGVPDPVWGEQVVAFVRPAEGRTPEPDRLRVYCRESLAAHKVPHHWIILDELPTTSSGKVQKFVLRDRFSATAGAPTPGAEDHADALRALRDVGRHQPVAETVHQAVQVTLNCSPGEVHADSRFADLGGDSLSALTFSKLLAEIFSIDVPVGVIIDPTSDLERLTRYIERKRDIRLDRPTFETVHTSDGAKLRASDLRLDKFIDGTTLENGQRLPTPNGEPRTVLLTGATGYLGRFLCAEWLERLAKSGGALICIARGSDPADARQRIEAALDSGDDELLERFRGISERLEVLPGDIGEPNLGLDDATWNRLASSVDLIVHGAALVNHVLPYSHLFGPNVVGTSELIRLALTAKLKPFNYVSTVAVSLAGDDAISEEVDIRIAAPVRTIDDTYANGYSTSKWASEVLLREAHDLCDLPVAVFRCDMILAHSRYAGQLNLPDMFTRLMLSLVATGIAPHSFYELDAMGNRSRAHYDGLPVDFIAEAIAELGGMVSTGFHTYNVVNPHDDGISLDQFVDWLIEAGHPIQRIDNYDEWLARFEAAMRALPARQRQHSELTLLDAFRPPAPALRGPALPAQVFRDSIRAAAIGPEHDIPHISASLIGKYITDLKQLQLL